MLQDTNYAISTATQRSATIAAKNAAVSDCVDEANAGDGTANDQGATSCITLLSGTTSDILSGETQTVEQAANDALGDGDEKSCEEISWFYSASQNKTAQTIVLGLLLGGFGAFAIWLAFYIYNRCAVKAELEKKDHFKGGKWKADTGDKDII